MYFALETASYNYNGYGDVFMEAGIFALQQLCRAEKLVTVEIPITLNEVILLQSHLYHTQTDKIL